MLSTLLYIYMSDMYNIYIIIIYIYIHLHIYIYIYIYIYGIHHWRILWSSYRKLVWVGFEPTTPEFRSNALTDWAIRPWAQLALRANFVQLLQFHLLFSVKFHFGYCLRQSPRLFWLQFSWGNHIRVCVVCVCISICIDINICIYLYICVCFIWINLLTKICYAVDLN